MDIAFSFRWSRAALHGVVVRLISSGSPRTMAAGDFSWMRCHLPCAPWEFWRRWPFLRVCSGSVSGKLWRKVPQSLSRSAAVYLIPDPVAHRRCILPNQIVQRGLAGALVSFCPSRNLDVPNVPLGPRLLLLPRTLALRAGRGFAACMDTGNSCRSDSALDAAVLT